MKRTVAYIVDDASWVQAKRAKDLEPYLGDIELHVKDTRYWGWSLSNPLSGCDAVWIPCWRILKARPTLLGYLNRERTLVSVTSHYHLGGGLKPEACFPQDCTVEEAERLKREALDVLHLFPVVTCNSKILYDLLWPFLGNRLRLCPNGVDTDWFYPDPRAKDRLNLEDYRYKTHIGWVGKRKALKNCETIREAVDGLDVRFRFVPILLEKTDRPLYTMSGMRRYYQALDYYLCASFAEGTPNPALEAGACGIPVITTRVGNMPELLEGLWGFIEPTIESITETCRSLPLPWSAQYEDWSEKMRMETMRGWNWSVRAQAYRNALEEVLR